MKILYFDTWEKTPDPIKFPGCLTVQVVSACSPGDQSHIRAQVSKTLLFKDIFKRSRRALKRAYRYAHAIGATRLISKVRSNILAYQSQLLETMSSVSGVVIEAEGDNMPGVGSMVAGFRTVYPLYTDFMLLHPQQLAEVPSGVSPEDAATAVYYAIALETFYRLQDEKISHEPVAVCGDTLVCRLLRRFLDEAGRTTQFFSEHNDRSSSSVRSLSRKGWITIIGGRQWFQEIKGILPIDRTFFSGISAVYLHPAEWQELESRWIGLPHEDIKNLNIFSRMHLEMPEYINRKGLQDALLDMSRRAWSPSSFLVPYDLQELKEGTAIHLETAYSLKGTDSLRRGESVIKRRKAKSPDNNALLRVGVAGLGLWARGNLIPFLVKDRRVSLIMGADRDPVRLHQAADLFDIPIICSDPEKLCRSDKIDAVFISTWHDAHAEIAAAALEAGKKVFVEKPPALNYEQLEKLTAALRKNPNPFLAVGYNRAHSTLTKLIRPAIAGEKGPVTFSAVVREPTIPRTHYYYWPHQGSRIVGNSCHWIDYAFHLLLPRMPKDIQVISAIAEDAQDNNVIIMRYADGSLASLTFSNRGEALINGDEYIDIKLVGSQYMIHDFKTCTRYREGKLERIWASKADRGWEQEMRAVVDGMFSGKPPREYAEIFTSAILVLEARYSYENNGAVRRISPELVNKCAG